MMNRLLFAFALFIVGTVAVAQNGVINLQTDQSQLTRNKGQLPGTATNDNASAGNLGERLTATATAVSLTTQVTKTIISQSLTAGDWDGWCNFRFAPAVSTTPTTVIGEISPTDNVAPQTLGNYFRLGLPFDTNGAPIAISTPHARISLSGTTTYFCTAFVTFGVSTLTADATIVARRRR